MQRLTERTKFGVVGNNDMVKNYPLYKVANSDPLDHNITKQCFEKLAEYEDLEEQGLLLRLPIETYRTDIPANGNSKNTEEYKIDWSEIKYTSYEELLSFLIRNEGNEDLIGKIRVGDICIDVINHPEIENVFFDFYVLHEDTGYADSKGIPYSYADGFSVTYNDIYVAMKRNQSMMENVETRIIGYIETFKPVSFDLKEHAKRELEIW